MAWQPARGHSDLHRAAVLALLGAAGSLSRSDIAQRLALSPATVTQLTKDLIGQGLIEELAQAPSRGGRPAQLLGLVGAPRHALGVKVAPDHLATALVGLDGVLRELWTRDFDATAADAPDRLVAELTALVGEVDGGVDSLLGVGLGVPGGVADQAEGVVDAGLLGWHGVPIGARLHSALRLPVLVENDVNALAVAERLYGRGQVHRDFLVVTIGVGVGAALVLDGEVYRGAHGDAGEFGHTPVRPDGPACVCGNRGCLEAVIGDRALLAAARADNVVRADQGIGDLRAAADGGDDGACAVFREAGAVFGRAVAGLVNVIDPELVVVFGEGAAVWRHWLPGFEPALRGHLMAARREVPVDVDHWDDRRWAQGAAALVLATPFDTAGATGEQGRLVRARLVSAPEPDNSGQE